MGLPETYTELKPDAGTGRDEIPRKALVASWSWNLARELKPDASLYSGNK